MVVDGLNSFVENSPVQDVGLQGNFFAAEVCMPQG